MIPAEAIAQIAALGLTPDQASVVAAAMRLVEDATTEEATRPTLRQARNQRYYESHKQRLNPDGQGLNSDGQGLNSDGQGLNSDGQGLNSDGQGLNSDGLRRIKTLSDAKEKEKEKESTKEKEKEKEFLVGRARTREAFGRFWTAWPNKVGKPYAEKCFAKVADQIEAILVGVEKYARFKPPDRPWLNPSTFLNQARWNDEPATIPTGGKNDRPQKTNLAHVGLDMLRRYDERVEREMRASGGASPSDPTVRLLPGFGRE